MRATSTLIHCQGSCMHDHRRAAAQARAGCIYCTARAQSTPCRSWRQATWCACKTMSRGGSSSRWRPRRGVARGTACCCTTTASVRRSSSSSARVRASACALHSWLLRACCASRVKLAAHVLPIATRRKNTCVGAHLTLQAGAARICRHMLAACCAHAMRFCHRPAPTYWAMVWLACASYRL